MKLNSIKPLNEDYLSFKIYSVPVTKNNVSITEDDKFDSELISSIPRHKVLVLSYYIRDLHSDKFYTFSEADCTHKVNIICKLNLV